jgi:hypothetical protein
MDVGFGTGTNESAHESDESVVKVVHKEESDADEDMVVHEHLKATRELVDHIKKLEAKIREIDKEDEKDNKEFSNGKKNEFKFQFSLRMIKDSHWKIIVGCFGLIIILRLVTEVIGLIEVMLKGSSGGE